MSNAEIGLCGSGRFTEGLEQTQGKAAETIPEVQPHSQSQTMEV